MNPVNYSARQFSPNTTTCFSVTSSPKEDHVISNQDREQQQAGLAHSYSAAESPGHI